MKKVALLDVDGTLVDSNDAHAESWVVTLRELGHDVPLGRVRELIGKGADKLLPETTGIAKESPEGKEIAARRTEVFMTQYLPCLMPFPGARQLLERMRADGYQLVVATSAQETEMHALLDVAGVSDLVEDAASAKDATDSKPDPDIVNAALRNAGCTPNDAVMLGDTPYDVEAATRAGVPIVALRCGGWSDLHLRGAIAIYDDPTDLLQQYEHSPLASWRKAS
jgi:HAD superfamily hydrolase (TIGR01509 family)